jgi:hypothetical protein
MTASAEAELMAAMQDIYDLENARPVLGHAEASAPEGTAPAGGEAPAPDPAPAPARKPRARPPSRTAMIRQCRMVRADLVAEMKEIRQRAIVKYARDNHSQMCEPGFQEWVIRCRLPKVTNAEIAAGEQSPAVRIRFPEIAGWPGAKTLDYSCLSDAGVAAVLAAVREKAAETRERIRSAIINAAASEYIRAGERDEALAALKYAPVATSWNAVLTVSTGWADMTARIPDSRKAELLEQIGSAITEIMAPFGGTPAPNAHLSLSTTPFSR